MKLKVVEVPTIRSPLRKSPGFAKKGLSEYALDLLALCGYGCRYCSSNNGNYLRIHRSAFADLAEKQLGDRLTPEMDPHLTYVWPDVLERLESGLGSRRAGFGRGQTVVFSMLTDGFSPHLVSSGTTMKALTLLVERTEFRIRVLTKNACVGSSRWLHFFLEHPGRFVVGLSMGTIRDEFAKDVEIGTSPPSARARAYANLRWAGIPTYGMMCPIFPDNVGLPALRTLLSWIKPSDCERVWAEPYNDRSNWRVVADGLTATGAQLLRSVYEGGSRELWSEYATDLYLRLREEAERGGWVDKLTYLLYEDMIVERDAARLGDLRGVLLQSKPAEDGFSSNPHVAAVERQTSHAVRI